MIHLHLNDLYFIVKMLCMLMCLLGKSYIVSCQGGLSLGLPGSPTKFEACKSILFTKDSFCIKNKDLLLANFFACAM